MSRRSASDALTGGVKHLDRGDFTAALRCFEEAAPGVRAAKGDGDTDSLVHRFWINYGVACCCCGRWSDGLSVFDEEETRLLRGPSTRERDRLVRIARGNARGNCSKSSTTAQRCCPGDEHPETRRRILFLRAFQRAARSAGGLSGPRWKQAASSRRGRTGGFTCRVVDDHPDVPGAKRWGAFLPSAKSCINYATLLFGSLYSGWCLRV